MFSHDKKIIYITKTQIEGVLVSGGTSPKIKARYTFAWTFESLSNVIKQVLDKLSNNNILLLLGDDISYVIRVTLPENISTADERLEVYKKIRQEIPETLDDNQWDYREYGITESEKQIIAFAPVKDVFQYISDVFHSLNCIIEAIEPVEVAKLRNPDPIIGIALKKDIQGDDEKTLNLQLFGKKIESNLLSGTGNLDDKGPITTENSFNNKEPKVRKTYLILLLLVFLFGITAISGIYYYRATRQKLAIQPSVKVTISPTTTPTPIPIVNVADIKTNILNGSGIVGQATSVADLLKEAGFKDIETGNADRYDYVNTEIQIKNSSESGSLEEKLKEALSDYKIEFNNSLQDASEFDLIIIVGQKNE